MVQLSEQGEVMPERITVEQAITHTLSITSSCKTENGTAGKVVRVVPSILEQHELHIIASLRNKIPLPSSSS